MLVLLSILRRLKYYQVRIFAVMEYTKERMNEGFPIFFLLLKQHKIHHR